jgi:hypothetical protein
MSCRNHIRSIVLLSPMLLALHASAQPADKSKADADLEAGINLCVQMRERIYECKEAFADKILAQKNPPAEQRAALRKKVIDELTADGSGPLEPRRQSCEGMGRGGKNLGNEWLATARKKLDSCSAMTDCQARLSCIQELMKPSRPKPAK